MFIEVKSKEDLIKKLNRNINKEIVVHYNCSECDDEQVTYVMSDDQIEDAVNQLIQYDCIFADFECTNCGHVDKFIYADYVQGIETDF